MRTVYQNTKKSKNGVEELMLPDCSVADLMLIFSGSKTVASTSSSVAAYDSNAKRSKLSNDNLLIVLCILTVTAILAIFLVLAYCARNRYRTMQRGRYARNQGSGDTYSERSSIDNDHGVALEQVICAKIAHLQKFVWQWVK